MCSIHMFVDLPLCLLIVAGSLLSIRISFGSRFLKALCAMFVTKLNQKDCFLVNVHTRIHYFEGAANNNGLNHNFLLISSVVS